MDSVMIFRMLASGVAISLLLFVLCVPREML